jgi:predicted TIM-barrel fold metal-dependent hydrolase
VFGATRAPDEAWLGLAAPESAIDPGLSIVDPHVHFWHHKSGYKYFLEEFARDVAACGHRIEATVYTECGSMYRSDGPAHLKPVGETEFAVGMAAMAASGKYTATRAAAAIVGFADLTQPDLALETVLAHLEAGNGRFRGIRQRAKWDADPAVRGPVSADRPGLYLEAGFRKGLALLAEQGLLFEASVFHPQLVDVAELAQALPQASIVVNHSGSPAGHSSYAGKQVEVHAAWLSGMKALARCPNVSIKLGGLLMSLGNFDFTTAERPPTSGQLAELWRPYIEPCVELFGAERCMASSNFPVDKAGMNYGTVWNMFKQIFARCSAGERALLLAGSARRIYGLPH